MRACSFLPAATQMIYDMNLQGDLYGVTFECSTESRKEKAIVVRCVLEDNNYTSDEIDKIFSSYKAQGKSLYYVEQERLEKAAPDVVFTQDVCEVCQIDTVCTASAVSQLPKVPELVALTPKNLKEVFDCAIQIATALGKEEAAYEYLSKLNARIDAVIDTLRKHKAPVRRVSLLEWIQPVYNCGHWIPYQIAFAGGIDMLSNPAGYSIVTDFDKIKRYNPEVLVIAPCGFETERAREELFLLEKQQGWDELQAVQNKQVYLADFDMFTQPSASTLVNGIEVLAALFHPEIFEIPAHLKHKAVNIYESVLV
ncbi:MULTISPECIES: ABC transporter substrate-binding protein [Flectobacillus]|uniref:ABC transporter substrate-binding protein n=2 Tax=Flectobacillus TaxID=101 RepID=A0ABT6Z557_9BACT|nr:MULTISPECIES: ABC transporter substrate-binding protein [Flectobacillus]MDI9863243.1 ABC transporter substrate-binding protein [Flectobacillus longus]MDI9876115.1 ABC transporter substrate-binding protein [Flectobacillus rivi]